MLIKVNFANIIWFTNNDGNDGTVGQRHPGGWDWSQTIKYNLKEKYICLTLYNHNSNCN